MSHRTSDGTRCNQWGHASGGKTRDKNGNMVSSERPSHICTVRREGREMENQSYAPPAIANPGNLIHTKPGGGNMGHSFAHDNEAPYPVEVPAFFIRSHAPPGGLVLDPFIGSGTTVHAALQEGRRGVGCDLRQSQCLLSRKRTRTVTPGFAFDELRS